MENLETHSLINYSRTNIKSKTIINSMFNPLNTKEQKLTHNGSTQYNIHNDYSSSVDIKKHNFAHKKNVTQVNFLSNYQKEYSDNKNEKEKNEHNISKRSIYKILVAVRCRPLSEREKEMSPKETVQIIDKKIIKMKDPTGFLNPNNIRSKEQILEFDYAFDNKDNQETIFNCTTKPLIEGILNGHEGSFRAFIKYETEYELVSIDEKIAAAKLDAEMIDESKPDAKIKALKRIEKLYLEKRDNRYFNTDLLKGYYNLARSLFKLHLVKETVEKDDYIAMDDYRPVKK